MMSIDLFLLKKNLLHFPVLIRDVLALLHKNTKVVVDCTFGAGGYSELILKYTNAKVIAIDRDTMTSKFATILKEKYPNRFFFYNDTFSNIDKVLQQHQITAVDVIIADLGVSTMQILQEDRGFSIKNDGPLSMAMGLNSFNAFEFINEAKESEISTVLWEYGEERRAKDIAKNIVATRKHSVIRTTKELKTIIYNVLKYTKNNKGKDSATKTFQAIRIHVNNELLELITMLNKVPYLIDKNGKIAIVTFHSLEDRIVKIFFNELSNFNHESNNIKQQFTLFKPINHQRNLQFNILTKKPIVPSSDEIKLNKNSSSAKLRIIQRIG